MPVADTDTPRLRVCVRDWVPLSVRPCEVVWEADPLRVIVSLGVPLPLAVDSWVVDTLGVPDSDALDDALVLPVPDCEEDVLRLGDTVELGEPLRLDDEDVLCDAVALWVGVAACDAVTEGVKPDVTVCDGDELLEEVPDMESLRDGTCDRDRVADDEGDGACVCEELADLVPVKDAVVLDDRVRLEVMLLVWVKLDVAVSVCV